MILRLDGTAAQKGEVDRRLVELHEPARDNTFVKQASSKCRGVDCANPIADSLCVQIDKVVRCLDEHVLSNMFVKQVRTNLSFCQRHSDCHQAGEVVRCLVLDLNEPALSTMFVKQVPESRSDVSRNSDGTTAARRDGQGIMSSAGAGRVWAACRSGADISCKFAFLTPSRPQHYLTLLTSVLDCTTYYDVLIYAGGYAGDGPAGARVRGGQRAAGIAAPQADRPPAGASGCTLNPKNHMIMHQKLFQGWGCSLGKAMRVDLF